jgi:hypothetical protein
MRYLYIPLDDRPVNYDTPIMLANVANINISTPPLNMLGHFTRPGNPDAISKWLINNAHNADVLVVSADMLAYGGLVASRLPGIDNEVAINKLKVLIDIKKKNPQIKIYMFSVIMRLTITSTDDATRQAARDIFEYCILRDKAERLNDEDAKKQLPALKAKIPKTILDKYLHARRRNHAINMAAVELLSDDVIDFLALAQEDTAPFGLHVTEQVKIKKRANEITSPDKWVVYAGTDEAGQVLLARSIAEKNNIKLNVSPIYTDERSALLPALFEDVPLKDTISSHLKLINANISPTGIPLYINTFDDPQLDIFESVDIARPTWYEALRKYPNKNYRHFDEIKGNYIIADTAYCNGGDPHLADKFLQSSKLRQCISYAGWNTAGNTVGSALAHSIISMLPVYDERKLSNLIQIRLLDDLLYQSIVRPWMVKKAHELGASIYQSGEHTEVLQQEVDNVMQKLWLEVCKVYKLPYTSQFKVTLPWGRLFEIKVDWNKDWNNDDGTT